MPFEIVRNDIIKMHVDAIVNPTNSKLFGTAGVDGTIHKIEGPRLREEIEYWRKRTIWAMMKPFMSQCVAKSWRQLSQRKIPG